MRRSLLLALLVPLAACDSPTAPEQIGPCDAVDETCRPITGFTDHVDDGRTFHTGHGASRKSWVATPEWRDPSLVRVGDLFRCPWE